ncbi:MAG TPA: copper chaperone PCu(A)C [Allosphingosinicella sp.]|nr:copper chaperone PCu(A)C [Allosphingosinicella sp.]
MKSLVPMLAALLLLQACGEPRPNPAAPTGPMVRLAAVPGRPAAGYFELPIRGDRGALLSVTSPRAGRIQMHETIASGAMTAMRPLTRVPVRDGETLRFASGGRHLMIYDVDSRVRPGDRIVLILNFERGAPAQLEAVVTTAGGETR